MRPAAASAVSLLLLLASAPAQEPKLSPAPHSEPTRPPTTAEVLALLDAPKLDGVAFERLLQAGEAAVPALVEALRSTRVVLPKGAPPGAVPTDVPPKGPRHERTLRALRALGPAASSAAPAVLEIVKGAPRERVPELLDLLSATVALGPEPDALHANAEEAWTPFIKPGDVNFIRILQSAIRLHMRMTRALPRDDVPALIQALEDGDPYVRELAALQLGLLGPKARAALDALANTAASQNHPRHTGLPNHSLGSDFTAIIRAAAEIAIARIAADDPRAVPGLRALLRADDPRERRLAAMALGRQAAAEAVDELLAATRDDDLRVVAEAVTSLGMIEVKTPAIVRAVQEFAKHEDPGIAARARATLRRLGAAPDEGGG